MAKRQRIPKSLDRQFTDLDHHLYILRDQLHALTEGEARLKVLAAELRVLICRSSGTDGLIWRLCRTLDVDDRICVQGVGAVKKDHPLATGLQFSFVPIQRAGYGPPELPAQEVSFERIVLDHEAVFVGGEGLTHDYLIKAVAQQMGSAHEDEGLEIPIYQLEQVFINGVYSYVPILAQDAEFALEVGERVLEKAESTRGFQRPARGWAYGNISIAVRLTLRARSGGPVRLFVCRSHVADAAVEAFLTPQGVGFGFIKRGKRIAEIEAPHPNDWTSGTDALFVLSYCSSAQRARTLTDPGGRGVEAPIPVGWVHAPEMILESIAERDTDVCFIDFISLYQKLLSSKDARGLIELEADEWGNWWSPDGIPLFLRAGDAEREQVFPP